MMKPLVAMSSSFLVVLVTSIAVELTTARVIDLSHDHDSDTFMSGAPKKYYYTRTAYVKGDKMLGVYVEANAYALGEHGGTHIDAPTHFIEGGRYLNDIPLEDTILEGVMVDCTKEVESDSEYIVTVEKLTDWEKVHGTIPDGAAVVFNFNRSSRFRDPKSFLETDDVSDILTYKYPYLSGEAADWMASQRNVKAIAVDTISPDGMRTKFPVHRRLLKENRLIVEGLKDPGLLPPRNFRFHFSPVKFVGGTGVQIRAYAMTHDQ